MTPVLMVRTPSEKADCGSISIRRAAIRSCSFVSLGKAPSNGSPSFSSTASVLLIVLSIRFKKNAKPDAPNREPSSASRLICAFFGLTGCSPGNAGSTTRATAVWMSPATLVSFTRARKVS